jgi:CubicO group peptidase (beta-lactamase class C family)
LAGRILELKTGRGFEELMRERVFDPLGLETTTYFAAEAIRHPVAVGHEGDPGELVISDPWPIPRRSNPAGGISSTTTQLLRFAQMHMNDGELDGTRILSPESARAMRELQAAADAFRTWGLGWSRNEIGGEVIVEHGGATNGFTARLVAIPGRQAAFAVLTNHDKGTVVHNAVNRAALGRFYGLESPERPVITLPEADLAAREGTYSHGLGDLILTATSEGYDVERVHRNPFDGVEKPGKPFTLRPVSETIFEASGGGTDGSYAELILNPDGTTRFLRFGGRLAYPQPH